MNYNLAFSTLAQREPVRFPNPRPGEGWCGAEIVPEAAQSWRWVNDVTLEVKLRPNLRYADRPPLNGRTMTAKDVAFSFTRLVKNHIRAEAYSRFVHSVEAVDDLTARFVFDIPLPGWVPSVMAAHYGAGIYPPEIVEAANNNLGPMNMVGSGPFYVESWTPGVVIRYARNANYFKQGLPYLDKFEWVVMPDMSTAIAGLRAGRLDLIPWAIPTPVALPLAKTDIQIAFCPSVNPGALFLWAEDPPFNDVRVRRAASMAINREAILKNVLQGYGMVGPMSIPVHPWYLTMEEVPPEVRKYVQYNPQEAKRLLADAGYPNGLDTTYVVSMGYGPTVVDPGWAYIADLEAVGIRAKTQMLDFAVQTARTARGEWRGLALSRGNHVDIYETLGRWHSKAGYRLNRGGLNDPMLDKLTDAFNQATDPTQAKNLAREIQIRAIDQVVWLVFPFHWDYGAFQPWVKGYRHLNPISVINVAPWVETIWVDK